MREFKFRAWDKKREKLFRVDGFSNMNYSIGSEFNYIVSNKGLIQTEDAIILQFTGLKDKNGKEIYEGDILKAEDKKLKSYMPRFEVVYVEYDTAFSAYDHKAKCWIKLNAFNYVIIGNIYENKELLK